MQKTTMILHDISLDSNRGRISTQVGIFGATSFDWISDLSKEAFLSSLNNKLDLSKNL